MTTETTIAVDEITALVEQLTTIAPDLVESGWRVRLSRGGIPFLEQDKEGWRTCIDRDLVECIKEARAIAEDDSQMLATLEPDLPAPLVRPAPTVGAPTPAAGAGFVLVPIDQVEPNPWQPREVYEPGHILALAEDIRARFASRPDTRGLLQLPAGRWVDGRMQLAYGHSRWKAFAALDSDEDDTWHYLPVNVVIFTNEEMATAAWSENAARKDLNAIEEARAIERYKTDFGWTDEQVAEQLKLNRSTIAHKRRLLRLPLRVQVGIANGTISERKAAALLPLCDVPGLNWDAPPGGINTLGTLLINIDKWSSDVVRRQVSDVIRALTHRLLDQHQLTHQVYGDIRQATCDGCPMRMMFDGVPQCTDRKCHQAKIEGGHDIQLHQAAQLSGIRRMGETDSIHQWLYTTPAERAEETRSLIAARCPHLRLRQGYTYNTAKVDGFPNAQIVVIDNGITHCECAHHAARRKDAAPALVWHQPALEENQPEPTTVELGQAVAPEEQTTVSTESAKAAVLTRCAPLLIKALLEHNVGAWFALWYEVYGEYPPFEEEMSTLEDMLKVVLEQALFKDLRMGHLSLEYIQEKLSCVFETAALDISPIYVAGLDDLNA